MKKRLAAQPGLSKKSQAVYLWVINKDGKEAARWSKCQERKWKEVDEKDALCVAHLSG